MAIRYWQPFQEMDYLRRQIDDLFSDVTNTNPVDTAWTPALRLVDSGNDYVLTMQLAGVDADSVDIQATREQIAIAGERKAPELAEGQRLLHDDVRYGRFRRVINLPDPIQNELVQASFDRGILTLTLPKIVEAQNKVVKINLGQLNGSEAPAIEAESSES
ncbi:heat-shock protein Hsp20 [filamentous cyanobacterium CCP5]|nr:heat-shock protein Hsp20 [filamentous cyanobacterium CCP5]